MEQPNNPEQISEQTPEQATEQADAISIAKEYFHAIHTGDHDRARELTSEDMRFSDPTAEGQEVVITDASREEFLAYLQGNSAGMDATSEVTKAFKTGKYVTLYVDYKGSFPGDAMGAPGKTLSFANDGITVITIENDKVVHHLDYIDYETINAQFAEQLGGE